MNNDRILDLEKFNSALEAENEDVERQRERAQYGNERYFQGYRDGLRKAKSLFSNTSNEIKISEAKDRQAEWKLDFDGQIYCSNCLSLAMHEKQDEKYIQAYTKFCPKCGKEIDVVDR